MARLLDIIRSLIPTFENLPALSSISALGGPGWLFGIFGTIALSLYGLSLGRTRAVLSLLSLYVAFVVIQLFPYKPFEDYWLKIGIFVSIYVIVFLIFNFSFIRKRLSSAEFSLFGVMLISLLQFGFLASIILSLLPEELAVRWSFGFYDYFATQQALFGWAVAPLPVLLFIKRK